MPRTSITGTFLHISFPVCLFWFWKYLGILGHPSNTSTGRDLESLQSVLNVVGHVIEPWTTSSKPEGCLNWKRFLHLVRIKPKVVTGHVIARTCHNHLVTEALASFPIVEDQIFKKSLPLGLHYVVRCWYDERWTPCMVASGRSKAMLISPIWVFNITFDLQYAIPCL